MGETNSVAPARISACEADEIKRALLACAHCSCSAMEPGSLVETAKDLLEAFAVVDAAAAPPSAPDLTGLTATEVAAAIARTPL